MTTLSPDLEANNMECHCSGRLLKSGKNRHGGIYKDPAVCLPLLSQNLTGVLFSWMFRILTALLWGGGSREAFPCQ